ncbi:SMI1 / KNR4 family (SUKH-1) [Actinopolyspora lacussalsi subsp. righensis]|uniref:SMI1 / KNR4 family (SUKH-1) n=1 Tax=Actinopolyspora righensis TaxID=995060 RepID=A0A1I7AKW8_9ACTN|nr:SMI1/KNR4 family protein [Actinopolyspora righensis]SFT75568.1 SMI1 / KNR4 family (SUKH-1) [Actinopolyspora righensis]
MTHVAGMESELPMASSLDRLRMLLPPPEVAPAPQPWQDVERRLGVALPNDYKEFMEVYGDGTLEDYLLLEQLITSEEEFSEWWEEQLDDLRSAAERVPERYTLEPGRVDLLPWGFTIDVDVCYWWMDPREDPDRWWIVSRDRDVSRWSVFEGSMVEFLVEVVSGRRREPWMPCDFPGDSPWFKTTARYLADTDPYK